MPKNAAGSARSGSAPTNTVHPDRLTLFTTVDDDSFTALLEGAISGYDVQQAIQANGYADIDDIKHVEFGNGITSIRSEVVDGYTWFGLFNFTESATNTSITRISFKPGSQLSEFGQQACANLSSLAYLEIPPLVTSLGVFAMRAGDDLGSGDVVTVIVEARATGISVESNTFGDTNLGKAALSGTTLTSYQSATMPANGVVNVYTVTL